MNRKLMFRHWGGKFGMKYFTFKDITMTFDHREGEEPSFAYVIHDDGIPQCIDCEDNGHEVMEYTGLKDKNGVNIYEGDIVRFKFSGRAIGVAEVKWNYGEWNIEDFSEHTGISSNIYNAMEIEVLGNIYQHAELLK